MGRLRSWLYRAVNAVPPEERTGLRLDGDVWQIAGTGVEPAAFFAALPTLVPGTATVILQGGSHPTELRGFLETHHVATGPVVPTGTIWPRPTTFRLAAVSSDLERLAHLVEHRAYPEVADHVLVCDERYMLLEWWDAFAAPLYVSKQVGVAAVETFSQRLGATYGELAAPGLPPP